MPQVTLTSKVHQMNPVSYLLEIEVYGLTIKSNHPLVGSFNQSTTYLAICSQPALQAMKTRSKCMINPDTAESNIWQSYHPHPQKKINLEQWNPKEMSQGKQAIPLSKASNVCDFDQFHLWVFRLKRRTARTPRQQRHSFKRSSELCRRKGNEAPPWPSNNGAPIAGGWPKAVGAVGPPLLEKKKVVHLFGEEKSCLAGFVFFSNRLLFILCIHW